MADKRVQPFTKTLWTNPIVQQNFPKHKYGDIKITCNNNSYLFKRSEVNKYSNIVSVMNDIDITSQCVKVADIPVEKVMKLLAGFSVIQIDSTEMLDALQVMIALEMDSLLEDAFDYMTNSAFLALKYPKLMEYNFKAFKKVLNLHKQTYLKRKTESPQNLGIYLTLSEQEEMIEEYCNSHQIASKKISLIMEYAIAATPEEKDLFNELRFSTLFDEIRVLKSSHEEAHKDQKIGDMSGSIGQFSDLKQKIETLRQEQGILKQGLLEITNKVNELIHLQNSRPDSISNGHTVVNPRDSINAQAKDMQNLLENQGILAQEIDKVLKEFSLIGEKMKFIDLTCQRLSYLQYYKSDNPILYIFPVDIPPRPIASGQPKGLKITGIHQIADLKEAAKRGENIVELYCDCSKDKDWCWEDEVSYCIAKFPNLQKLVLNKCLLNYESNIKYLSHAIYTLYQLRHIEIAGFGISKNKPSPNDRVVVELAATLKSLKSLTTLRIFHSQAFPEHCKKGVQLLQEVKTPQFTVFEVGLWKPGVIAE